MAAILRVKRRHNDEPLNALVIACKRCKTTENDEIENATDLAPVTAVVKFAGTITNQNEDVIEHLVKTVGKNELKANYKRHVVDVKNVIRERTKQISMENRYKVVNCCRSLDTLNTNELEDTMTVIDVEDSLSCSTTKNVDSETLENFVYDLYYTQTGSDMIIDDLVSVHGFEQEFVFDMFKDEDDSSNGYETEDSNSESHWWNDYPDTEHSDLSVDEDDMRRAVMKINLDDDESSDLSSEDDFICAINKKDVEQYGYKYAQYKAKIKQELSDTESDSSDDVSVSRIL
ncbi:putative RNA polymerase II nuclear localization protein SLC7A6OS [Vespula maculifrons]|uniref:Probable RNA polymerase II nuclear localization protein SLC7A6OS n=2 Tax=Vespula TaxID=7451 RepID=A0A834KDE7_VESVU|nr:probable RNA polymerase II nuclear localization protein SLC7A6OS [Vespula vulgaris]KAF7404698.1 hypothetical protein HZH66_003604 [Vespula vulgaris]